MAVNSVKATYPSEAARLETIIRGTADKFYALRRELKRLKMEIALTKAASINPTDDIVDALMVSLGKNECFDLLFIYKSFVVAGNQGK